MRSVNSPTTTNSPESSPMTAAKTLLVNSVQHLVRRDQFDPNDADVRCALDSLDIAIAALPIASGDYSMVKNRLEAIKHYRRIREVGAMRWELDLLLHWLRSMGWITAPGDVPFPAELPVAAPKEESPVPSPTPPAATDSIPWTRDNDDNDSNSSQAPT